MDTLTGRIVEEKLKLAMIAAGEREERDFVRVRRRPDGTCLKCAGTGRRRAGLFSRRFKPCECIAEKS